MNSKINKIIIKACYRTYHSNGRDRGLMSMPDWLKYLKYSQSYGTWKSYADVLVSYINNKR